ncbi:MAG: nucleotide exchange factor GrpE [Candidatus Paceibacteria bacterium]
MAKKQDVEQKDSQAEDIDLNLDDVETDDFIQEAKEKAKASRGSQSEEESDITEDLGKEQSDKQQSDSQNEADKEDSSQEQETSQSTKDSEDQTEEQTEDEEEITVSKKEWEDLKKEAQKNLDGWQRALADYHNLQKQSREERERLVSEANENLMRSLMPLLDNFNLALQHLPEDLEGNNWVEGVTYINKQMMEILQDEGLEVVEPEEGTELDPERHEAVKDSETSEDEEEGESNETPKIQKVVQSGYVFHDKVLKPAKVVAK